MSNTIWTTGVVLFFVVVCEWDRIEAFARMFVINWRAWAYKP